MLKRMLVILACVSVMGISPSSANAYTIGPVGGFILRQVVKRVSKSAAVKYLDEGAEKQCVYRIFCAKVAR